MRLITVIFFMTVSITCISQGYEPKKIDYANLDLLPPMKIPLILAGNFCEMRSNHFHTGLDIKTQGVEGQHLYAIEEGTLSRVRVSPWGYGLAVYIDHPNGLTSLYGHMKSFSPVIDSLVYALQKQYQSYTLDEDVRDKGIKFKRGEFIGLSGNSGSSSAAHLHFEIRETASEHAINPLLFKCYQKKISDKTKPTLKGIKVYAVTEKGYMIPGKSKYFFIKNVNGELQVNNGEPIDVSEFVTENTFLAFAFHITDQLDGAGNICGIYHTYLKKGEELLHEQQTEYMNFDHNRFLNTHQDYFEFSQNKRDVHKNFKTVVNPLPIYPKAGGLVDWSMCNGNYSYKAFDVHGNSVIFHFKVQNNAQGEPAKNPFDQEGRYYFPDSVNTLLHRDFQLLIEPGTFYEPLQKIFRIDSSKLYLTCGYKFSESEIPVQKNFDVRIKVPDLPENFPFNKLGIGIISDQGWMSFKGGDYINGWVESSARDFGTFVLVVDSIPPKIDPVDFSNGKTITKYNNLQLTIEDNLAGVWNYKAFINGEWALMEFDRRKKRYIIPLDERSRPLLKNGENEIRIWAKDSKGNISEGTWTVVY